MNFVKDEQRIEPQRDPEGETAENEVIYLKHELPLTVDRGLSIVEIPVTK